MTCLCALVFFLISPHGADIGVDQGHTCPALNRVQNIYSSTHLQSAYCLLDLCKWKKWPELLPRLQASGLGDLVLSFPAMCVPALCEKCLLWSHSRLLFMLFFCLEHSWCEPLPHSLPSLGPLLQRGLPGSSSSQAANTRPVGRIWPFTLFYLAWRLVSTQRQH